MYKFRNLTTDEIEVRLSHITENNSGSFLIYKDARVDMKLLDEVVGAMNWQRTHEVIDNSLYCTISIWDKDKKEWIAKQDVGTAGKFEREKGQASDAFKRAGVNVGIGRELYTAPDIWIRLADNEVRPSKTGGKELNYVSFHVKDFEVNDEKVITKLVIADNKGKVRFTYNEGKTQTTPPKKKSTYPKPIYARPEHIEKIKQAVKDNKESGKENYIDIMKVLNINSQNEIPINKVDDIIKHIEKGDTK